jgi:hypothetical protein
MDSVRVQYTDAMQMHLSFLCMMLPWVLVPALLGSLVQQMDPGRRTTLSTNLACIPHGLWCKSFRAQLMRPSCSNPACQCAPAPCNCCVVPCLIRLGSTAAAGCGGARQPSEDAGWRVRTRGRQELEAARPPVCQPGIPALGVQEADKQCRQENQRGQEGWATGLLPGSLCAMLQHVG